MAKKNRSVPSFVFILQLFLFVSAFFALLFRFQRGVDLTDESWYVAEPYLVSQGQLIPYVNNWSQVPGFTLPLALIFNLYTLLRGTEGIMLFSRLLYLVWVMAVTLLTAFIVHQAAGGKFPFIWSLPLLLTTAALFDVSYNSIGSEYLPLVLALVYAAWSKEGRCALISGVIAGTIGARMIIGTPQVFPACIILLILLFAFKRRRLALGILLGVAISAALVIGWCCIRGGISGFLYGMKVWLVDNYYFKLESRHSFAGDLRYLLPFLRPAYVFFLAVLGLRLLFLKKEKAFSFLLVALILLFLLYGALNPGFRNGIPKEFYRFAWFESFGLIFCRRIDRCRFFVMLTTALNAVVYLFSSFTNIYGFSGREYWLVVPVSMSCLSLLLLVPWDAAAEVNLLFPSRTSEERRALFRSFVHGCFVLLIVLVFLLQLRASFLYSYRDAPVDQLTVKVESGIWKSCYTTEERAGDVEDLEAYIRSRTDETDRVFFLDWVSFAYLMNNGEACTSMTLDPNSYTYKINEPRVLFDYYKLVKTVPNKIIYIDYGRDNCLSIEDLEWKFNAFVDSFYNLTDTYKNQSFRVLIYDLTDFTAAMEYAALNSLS